MPGSSSHIEASISAAPHQLNMAPCVSWPQACMTGTFSPLHIAESVEANGTSTRFFTDSASIGPQGNHWA